LKCGACGYEKEIDYVDSEESINPDGKDFRFIYSGVTSGFSAPRDKDDGYYSEDDVQIGLYICPECGTVHAEEVLGRY